MSLLLPLSSCAPSSLPPQGVRLAALATLYALPIVVMDLTRRRLLAYPGARPNRFINRPILANAFSRTIVRPNVDSLYSSAWLDLSDGPMLLTLPPANGQYFVVQCMDAWSNVFASLGSRRTGDRPVKYLIVGADWHGRSSRGVTIIRAPTRMVWVLARIYVANPDDLAPARRFQSGLDIRPLSRMNDLSYHSIYPRAVIRPVMRASMLVTLQRMGPQAFFALFRALERANPAVPPDPQFDSRVLQPLGLGSDESRREPVDLDQERRVRMAGFKLALRMLDDLDRRRALLRRPSVDGWTTPGNRQQAVFGKHYGVRAMVALWGLAEGPRDDTIYFNVVTDGNGKPLDGSRSYTLTFPPGRTPPVHAFWSITLYDEQGFLVANPDGRYGIRSRDPLHSQSDGSLIIYLQPDRPVSAGARANWIPTPAGHSYQLTLRCYWPGAAVLGGYWRPPAIMPDTVTAAAVGTVGK